MSEEPGGEADHFSLLKLLIPKLWGLRKYQVAASYSGRDGWGHLSLTLIS